jgi:hypothetical protein
MQYIDAETATRLVAESYKDGWRAGVDATARVIGDQHAALYPLHRHLGDTIARMLGNLTTRRSEAGDIASLQAVLDHAGELLRCFERLVGHEMRHAANLALRFQSPQGAA